MKKSDEILLLRKIKTRENYKKTLKYLKNMKGYPKESSIEILKGTLKILRKEIQNLQRLK